MVLGEGGGDLISMKQGASSVSPPQESVRHQDLNRNFVLDQEGGELFSTE